MGDYLVSLRGDRPGCAHCGNRLSDGDMPTVSEAGHLCCSRHCAVAMDRGWHFRAGHAQYRFRPLRVEARRALRLGILALALGLVLALVLVLLMIEQGVL